MSERFLAHTGARVPMICGAMYPCSNPELVGAVVGAGAVGVVQPLSIVFAHRLDLRTSLRQMQSQNQGGALGFNALVEKSSKVYEDRMRKWVDIALEEGVRFFVTALGNPDWVVEKVHAVGGVVYHDVTERKWALKALESDVDGLICVNGRAGGHAGAKGGEELFEELHDLGVPLVMAGGVGGPRGFVEALDRGYEAVQLGTRFIATEECSAHADYKQAIVKAGKDDIVLTRRISGVPVSVIRTPFVERVGTEVGPLARRMLQHPRFKHWMRGFYAARSVWSLGRGATRDGGYNDYWQAGKSVDAIDRVRPVAEIVAEFEAAYRAARAQAG
ncbi:2-nitropropane dioxygenase [Lujinxingia litoralis]|uniref:2-nitropropane dioxygenase n=1 Tax=Lujinxingia litoralis TaxID=2211119 RepID=A0A328CAJ9_9DELT|nr:nitronate monooxygenase [Lujinxingia litoralis]RAL22277.1 2-nitropropane dioxygenase [Lujinxingia litoralis]